MGFDPLNALVPAILIVIVVLALEEWAFFKARTRFQRALITGVAVFVLLVIFSSIPI